VPEANAQQAALQVVKEVFASDYAAAKTPEQKAALAQKLYDQAKQTNGDPVSRYVLLGEARTTAIDGGNVNVLRDALVSLVHGYEVDETTTYVDAWNELLRRPRDATTYRSGTGLDEHVL
jgi:hypothetical protein